MPIIVVKPYRLQITLRRLPRLYQSFPTGGNKIGEECLPARFTTIPQMFGMTLYSYEVVIIGCFKGLDDTVRGVSGDLHIRCELLDGLMMHRIAADMRGLQDCGQP